jgi:drug/metabolite transporter (DMT)-like permease
MNDQRKQYTAEVLLVFAMFTWGITFSLVKEIVQTLPVHWFHTLRFSIGAVALWGLLWFTSYQRTSLPVPKPGWKGLTAATLMGAFLFLSYAFQTLGLVTTTASKSAFITGTAVLWVPFLMLVALRIPIERKALLTGVTGLAGLLLLVANGGWSAFREGGLVIGDAYTVLCALAIAMHLLMTNRYSHRYDITMLAAVQVTVVAVLSLVCTLLWKEPWSFSYSLRVYGSIAFLGLVTTALNFWILTWALRHTTAQRCSVIYLFEPLFAAAVAWIILGEKMEAYQWCGAALIIGAVCALELRSANGDPKIPKSSERA